MRTETHPSALWPTWMGEANPDRADELRGLLAKLEVTFVTAPDAAACFWVHTGSREITVGPLALGRLWAHLYGACRVYDACSTAPIPSDQPAVISLRSTPAMRDATDLMKWATEGDLLLSRNRHAAESRRWIVEIPADLPKPFSSPTHGDMEHAADDLTARAASFILLHELGHLECQHDSVTHANEFEADDWATRWLLGAGDEEPLLIQRRLLGVAAALTWLVIEEVHLGVEKSVSHPPSCERLRRVLARYVTKPNELVWAFVGVWLEWHFQLRGSKPDPSRVFDSHRDAALYRLDMLAPCTPPM